MLLGYMLLLLCEKTSLWTKPQVKDCWRNAALESSVDSWIQPLWLAPVSFFSSQLQDCYYCFFQVLCTTAVWLDLKCGEVIPMLKMQVLEHLVTSITFSRGKETGYAGPIPAQQVCTSSRNFHQLLKQEVS